MDAELKKLSIKRGQIKGKLTRFANFIKCHLEIADSKECIEMQTRLDTISSVITDFETIQSQIECLVGECDEAACEERETFENAYYDAVVKAKQIISAYETKINDEYLTHASGSSNTNSSRNVIQNNIKLPAMSLPEFYGDYHKWVYFRDTFSSLIDKNPKLSNVEKFHYLSSCLKGDALNIIQSLDVSDANYENAWQLVQNRFQSKNLIIEKHLEALFNSPVMEKESHQGLIKLLNNLEKNIHALKSFKEPTDSWNSIIIYLFKTKLDPVTKREWQEHAITFKSVPPTLNEFTAFLRDKCELLDTIQASDERSNMSGYKINSKNNRKQRLLSHISTQNPFCTFCKNTHYIYHCKEFLALSIKNRFENAKKLRLCLNCLRDNHFAAECKVDSQCKKCKKPHNTLLHFEKANSVSDQAIVKENKLVNIENVKRSVANHSYNSSQFQVLLSTAIIYVKDIKGELHKCRALLDSGSQSNFMTQELFDKLKLRGKNINMPVLGIGQNQTNISLSACTKIKSIHNEYEVELSFLVLSKITESIPNLTFSSSSIKIPSNLKLADPNFNITGKIDLLLGASIFFSLLCVGQIKLGNNKPILQKSKFGWILSGLISANPQLKSSCNFSVNSTIENTLERFWQLEELSDKQIKYSKEEQECEDEFLSTYRHDETGHIEVRLPIRENIKLLGDSEAIALKRFQALENKLAKNTDLRKQYIDFMNEFEELGHMSKIDINERKSNKSGNIFYLPHHGVLKADSVTTKLRVVFDGSAKTTSGISLNDTLKVGPKLQDDLFDILVRFRKHVFVLSADITKMYRQINIAKDQRDLQRIVWRTNSLEHIEHFHLNTVTYGTAPASFLAIRALNQVAYENIDSHPAASQVILHDFYVDDLLTGANSVEEAKTIKREVSEILSKSGFELRKWLSNENSILEGSNERELIHYFITDKENIKTLGIFWDANMDCLKYNINSINIDIKRVTKRTILSTISRIFDPLGLLGPATIRAKIILQRLWQLKIQWDETVPIDLFTSWQSFFKQLSSLTSVKIPRQVFSKNVVDIQFHGFCDASTKAYGCCLYARSVNSKGEININLLCAKSRVAPLKSVTLPRLELCGAVLLVNLVNKVLSALELNRNKIYLWTDSTIVLNWIAAEPSTWQTFVSNRVAQIQNLSNRNNWKHVISLDNPADVISRGIDPSQLINCKIWWNGPNWLTQESDLWPTQSDIKCKEIPDTRKVKFIFTTVMPNLTIFERYSTLFKLQRVMAYCLRFIGNIGHHRTNKIKSILTTDELENALITLVRMVQLQAFSAEIKDLKNSRCLSLKSKLLSLNPFLDDNEIIRVGGRLAKAALSNDVKFPMVLPEKHIFTNLVISNEHHRQLHAGAQAVLASVRLRFWPLNGRKAVRSVLRKCVTCFKVKPTDISYQMASLPSSRITPSRPFKICGVDYAGPFNVRDGKLRNRKIVKTYVCLFVCFTTKAVHLEVVGDLTTEAFINALKRFVSRRGLCSEIHSDNATNFVGAEAYFKNLYKLACRDGNPLSNFLSKNVISWKFIPPRSPHFGGLWEAAIKAAKSHMKRVIRNVSLTFEELYTVVAQIEATLNSRPLIPLSNDPNDLVALTPGHFLIGDYLNALPQQNVTSESSNRLTRFKLMQQMVQHFWSRWSREYLSNLHQRTKWQQRRDNHLKPGALVILKDTNTAPLQWKMGRIIEVFPGQDGVVRVVNIKTHNGEVRRAAMNVCPLPIDALEAS